MVHFTALIIIVTEIEANYYSGTCYHESESKSREYTILNLA